MSNDAARRRGQHARALAVVEGGWVAACMSPAEWDNWVANNPRNAQDGMVDRPCVDCPLGFAIEMRGIGKCNGQPAGVEQDEDDDAMTTQQPAPRSQPAVAIAEVPPTPEAERKRLGVAPGYKRSSETRERMRQGQIARYAGIRAQIAGVDPAGKTAAEVRREVVAKPAHIVSAESPIEAPAPSPGIIPPHRSRKHIAPVSAPPLEAGGGPVDVVAPCNGCAHAPVCALKALLVMDAWRETVAAASPFPALRITAVSIDCEHFLAVTR